ncbi:AAA family ATPase [Methermicoccus shengliensis]|uniref:AAA family ATPase n=1 Tax=Methermicoccus shengliensis TaxID=660064 RepID=A0A832RXD6_9EURY|nr:AAA family ATPase [Methermicoccus shengliensis]KUK03990.1 MAG: Cobyrinic acid ac-diamide synthase [Euryarchaeota archaeon 55_53]KUK29541.1 MAG: Cobyrinic acid ac-diamide synthase [Methanosarcinales archeaon 56_1174]MDI3487614.1 dehydrogenase maturation factor [Methanosarcinales archaeon]MDN5294947.1 dehydrogenase maturation factor [Methanosarcinales archaeon]HIH69953.1 AAA family ATPase [Methermicoccus shengliensis]
MTYTIAITGKGGTGKTAIAAMLIRHLVESEVGVVLAVDADPDANLADVLGVRVERTVGDMRELMLESVNDLPPDINKESMFQAKIYEVIEEFKGYDLLVMGRPDGPGCYCYVNNLLRGIMDKVMRNYDVVVIDTAAGLEHLSRRLIRNIDVLLVITDASRRGIRTAERIRELASSLNLNVKKLYLVLNKVRDESRTELEKVARELSLEVVGSVPYDEHIAMLDLLDEPVGSMENGSAALEQVREIAKRLLATKAT